MSFLSWQYAFFLTAVFLIYWRLGLRGRLMLLLAASYFFYAVWDVRFLALLLTSTAIDFYCGLAINRQRRPVLNVTATALLPFVWLLSCRLCGGTVGNGVGFGILGIALVFPCIFTSLYVWLWRFPEARRARVFLLLSILTNLGVLGYFKYFNFFADSLIGILSSFGWQTTWALPNIILPVAISFYTFQSIAYSVDIYRGRAKPAESLLTFAAYLSFFPQLVAGPIERPNHLLPQFLRPAVWNVRHLHEGLRLILVGVFKKVFVADNCALVANYVFNGQPVLNGEWAILGVIAFAFQIYGDFSGYTDIARGSARLLGIELSYNFHFPYSARNPSEFWQRWHITLSAWFRDYVYIPLGGNRCSAGRMLVNLWVTMLLAGLWHGASWTFVLWGAYHAVLLTFFHLANPSNQPVEQTAASSKNFASIAVMFLFTLIGWAIFRSHDLGQLGRWLGAFTHWQKIPVDWRRPIGWLALHIVPLILLQVASRKSRDESELGAIVWPARGVIYAVMFIGIATTLSLNYEFIYFQF